MISKSVACYSMTLQSLVLPNAYIHNGYGANLNFYSHVYVEFYSATMPAYDQPIISNNRNTRKDYISKLP